MTILEKLGLILMLYGVALHTWHHIPTLIIANGALFVGALLLLTGCRLTHWLKTKFPSIPW